MTVLVLAPERDPTADRMIRELSSRKVPVIRCDTAWFPREVSISAEFDAGSWRGTLTIRQRPVELEELRSVWFRSPSTFVFSTELSDTERRWAQSEAKLGLGGVLTALPMLWINHPSRLADAAAKPVQLAVAARCGLRVPHTLVTNRAESVRDFARAGTTVTKALGAAAVVENGRRATLFTRVLSPGDLADLRGVEITTHQFQRWVPKACEARVVAVGERLFAAEIHAGTAETRIDWRNSYADLIYRRIEVPVQVRHGVHAYLRAMGLSFGAFDFVIEPDGSWCFLECNAGGQYGWIEDAISAPITAALADLLATGRHT